MYVLTNEAAAIKFPYSIARLQADNPQVSFPANPSPEVLASYGVYHVTSVDSADEDCWFNEGLQRWETGLTGYSS